MADQSDLEDPLRRLLARSDVGAAVREALSVPTDAAPKPEVMPAPSRARMRQGTIPRRTRPPIDYLTRP